MEYSKYILHPEWIESWFSYTPAIPGAFEILFLFRLREPELYSVSMKRKIIDHFINNNDYFAQLFLRYHRDLKLVWEESEINELIHMSKTNFATMTLAQLFLLSKIKA